MRTAVSLAVPGRTALQLMTSGRGQARVPLQVGRVGRGKCCPPVGPGPFDVFSRTGQRASPRPMGGGTRAAPGEAVAPSCLLQSAVAEKAFIGSGAEADPLPGSAQEFVRHQVESKDVT